MQPVAECGQVQTHEAVRRLLTAATAEPAGREQSMVVPSDNADRRSAVFCVAVNFGTPEVEAKRPVLTLREGVHLSAAVNARAARQPDEHALAVSRDAGSRTCVRHTVDP